MVNVFVIFDMFKRNVPFLKEEFYIRETHPYLLL